MYYVEDKREINRKRELDKKIELKEDNTPDAVTKQIETLIKDFIVNYELKDIETCYFSLTSTGQNTYEEVMFKYEAEYKDVEATEITERLSSLVHTEIKRTEQESDVVLFVQVKIKLKYGYVITKTYYD